jgi:predicted patatin/cPLA2 family phospholipase
MRPPTRPGPFPPSGAGIGLVLEGGGMRGAYTAGVLDAFMDAGIDIPYVIGVSAGSNAGSAYVSGQRERGYRTFVEFASHRRYAGFANLLRERSWFGMHFIFETLPDELAPFEYEAFQRSARTFVVGVTDAATGRPVYYRQHDHDPRWFVRTVMRASCSLPVLSRPVDVEGRRCFDGGVSDSIPIERSISDGNLRNVVVLTRNAGYRKDVQRLGPVSRLALARYPSVRRAIAERDSKYNACLDRLESLEETGQAFVLRPIRLLTVDRLERNVSKLDALYHQGYDETLDRLPALQTWLTLSVEFQPN